MVALAVAVTALWMIARSPDFPILSGFGQGEWITAPIRVDTNAIPIHPDQLPTARLLRRFELPEGGPLKIRLQALRGYELRLNHQLIASREAAVGNWKREESFEVATGLAAANLIQVTVRNTTGPAILRLHAEAPGFELASDATWSAMDRQGATRPAVIADDTRGGAIGLELPSTWQSVLQHRDALIGFATLAGLISIGVAALAGIGSRALLGVAWALAAAVWGFVFLRKGLELPAFVGFDGPAHIDYVRFILDKGTLPFPEDGFSMYHPPLFYGVAAALVSLAGGAAGADDAARASAEMAIRGVTALAGFSQIAIAHSLCRLLFPGDALRQTLSVAICALLPMNLYMSMYVSNEPLNAALAGLTLLLTVDLILRDDMPTSRVLGLATVLGLALLTKATSLLLLPLVGVALLLKHGLLDRAPLASLLLRSAAGLAALAAISGWYFLRNLIHLGQPTVGNWNITYNDVGWFQQPGFHSPSYYFRFGESLSHPFFAGFHSFWDGMYSTFWGDGLAAGIVDLSQRHPFWNYDFMTIGYLLALPATAILLCGFAVFCFSRTSPPRRRLALAFLGVTILFYGGAVLLMTLRLPFYAQAKASYALSVVAPISVAGAHAFAWLHERTSDPSRRWLRVLLHAWAGALAIVLMMAFCG